jgi:hypothetical protein
VEIYEATQHQDQKRVVQVERHDHRFDKLMQEEATESYVNEDATAEMSGIVMGSRKPVGERKKKIL